MDSSERCALASNTSLQCPQRTQPSEIFSWSGTTRNIVPQAGQLVIRLMGVFSPGTIAGDFLRPGGVASEPAIPIGC
jgi:hypothetical protein